jgi:hypothetical protein
MMDYGAMKYRLSAEELDDTWRLRQRISSNVPLGNTFAMAGVLPFVLFIVPGGLGFARWAVVRSLCAYGSYLLFAVVVYVWRRRLAQGRKRKEAARLETLLIMSNDGLGLLFFAAIFFLIGLEFMELSGGLAARTIVLPIWTICFLLTGILTVAVAPLQLRSAIRVPPEQGGPLNVSKLVLIFSGSAGALGALLGLVLGATSGISGLAVGASLAFLTSLPMLFLGLANISTVFILGASTLRQMVASRGL